MASTGVNVPTNESIKEKDINSKLQLYGIFNAFSNGKVPSNKQVDVAMNSALEWEQLRNPSKKLSSDGQLLVRDLRNVIEQAKMLMLSKNDGNLIQDFIWQTQGMGSGDAQKPNAPLDKETAKQHGNQAVENLRTIGELLITNGQFRKLLSDASILFRDMAGDAAQKSASKVKPSEDELNQIDEPAEDNTWHEKPDMSRDTMSKNFKSKMPIGKKDMQDAAGNATQQADPSGSRDPRDAADKAAYDQQQGTDSGVDAAGGAKAGAKNLKDKISANSSEDQKQKAREYRERTNNYFKEKVPKERREQIVYRLKKMVVEIQGHQDYMRAIDGLLSLAEEYTGHTKNMVGQGGDAVKGAHSQDTLRSAEMDLKTLLERFANSTSFDDLIDSVNQIYSDADRDPELKDWFRSMNTYIRRCLKEQGYILEDSSNEQWNRLYDHGNFLLRDRYKNHTDRIADEFKFVGGQFDEDPQNKAFAESMNRLFDHLGKDENGQQTFKPHLLKDLSEVIIPGFFESVRYVPIPRIEYSDKMIDAVVENLCLEGDNLAPNMFEFGSDNYWRWGRKTFTNRNKNKVMLSVSGIQMDIRDVAYYVKKKEGFPSITDKGVMDIFLGGTGLSFKVAMETADPMDRQHFFKINSIHVDIKNLNLKVKQSNHKLLFALAKPILLKVMRPVLQKVIEKQVRDNVTALDAKAYAIKKEADRAAEEAKRNPDPDNVQSMYQRYFTAAQQQMSKGQNKAEEKKQSAGQTNIAMTKHDSIFKDISLPGGISTKATEYKDLAAKGDRWESPVFSIGGARASSNLPTVSNPTRKQHSVTQGGVRGERGLDNQGMSQGMTGGSRGYDGQNDNYGQTNSYGQNNSYGQSDNYSKPTSNGFGNQVSDAFQSDRSQDLGLGSGGMTGSSHGPVGTSNTSGLTSGTSATGATGFDGTTGATNTGGTLLGRNNPIFQGNA